ncbi:N-acetylneuraminate 9-O-acetyltransferase-like isoform X2 [Lineus longissimus]|uniref:N-acetylneuraminate 9-O-acetyltransferase-like isoform X2 n=1 Tax=Lineus longissimus TaxID=88925 RepID=UPI00315D0D4B
MVDHKKHGQASREVIHLFNVNTAKYIAICMVLTFVIYHGALRYKYGNDSCKWLMGDGRFQGHNVWQPYGCMMHHYSRIDARNCMHYISYWGGHNHIVFMGDSRIRELFYEFVDMFTPKYKESHHPVVHSNVKFRDEKINLKVDFLWVPMVNGSMYNIYKAWVGMDQPERPNLVITSAALWTISHNNGSLEALGNFKVNLTYIVPFFDKLKKTTKVFWRLQDPVEELKRKDHGKVITNPRIDEYNRGAIDILQNSAADIWSSSRLVCQGTSHPTKDGTHLTSLPLLWDNQILFNMYCNNNMGFNDGTCCSNAEPITTIQIITAIVFALCVLLAFPMWVFQKKFLVCRKNANKGRPENGHRIAGCQPSSQAIKPAEPENAYYVILIALAKLGLIMTYFFICDRTTVFMKENKAYTLLNFLLPFAYVMVLGFFFTEDSDQSTILHRDQTDEWKGWMQLVILIYHITGASRVLPIYMHIRVLVSAYLFLSGYGHFVYFWNNGKLGIQRVCQVLFRLNMLVVSLCFTMNRPYQFYYFIPLVSFWFLVSYLTMVIWPQATAAKVDGFLTTKVKVDHCRPRKVNFLYYVYMLFKLIILAGLVSLLFLSEVLFEKIFLMKPFKALFVMEDDSLHEWRFRWQLDRYSVLYGIMFAFACTTLKKLKILNDSGGGMLFPRTLSLSITIGSVLGILSYAVFSMFCRSKEECNDIHSYIVFLPIISYIFLRNTFHIIRQKYSTFFAWFGKISLELFIAQYHIWLAADTHGVLVLVPSNQVLNVIVTTFIFICVCHEVHIITVTLAKYAVPNDWKLALRNCICFWLILIPIGVKRGVFS